MKLYAIGDIHGCFDALEEVLGMIYEDIGDDRAKIVFLGDYTDRGPKSCQVVQKLIALEEASDPDRIEYVFLRGNHDSIFLDHVFGRDSWSFANNGGMDTKKSYEECGVDMMSHAPFMAATELVHRHGKFVFAHAGIDPHQPWDEQTEHTYTWERGFTQYNGDFHDSVTVVHGHTPVPDVYMLRNQVNIDTGCCFGRSYSEDYGKLTGVRLNDNGSVTRFQARQYQFTGEAE